MVKPISQGINRQIVDEYAKGQISQAKLAIQLGVSRSHIFRVLHGKRIATSSSGDRLLETTPTSAVTLGLEK